MSDIKKPILVFGATGQQGGSVTTALLKAGWPVRALVRDTASAKSVALRDAGVELVRGTLADTTAIVANVTIASHHPLAHLHGSDSRHARHAAAVLA